MTDDHTDTDLDHRIRSGLAALVAEAPDPPPLPEAPATGAGRRSFMLAAAVVLVLLAVGAVVLGAVGDDAGEGVIADGPPTAPEAADLSLVGPVWMLEEMASAGALSFTRGDFAIATLTFAGPACASEGRCADGLDMVGESRCGGFQATVSIEDQVVDIGDGASDDAVGAPECEGPAAAIANVDLVGGVPVSFDPFTYAIDGDRLRITSTDGGTELTYRAGGSSDDDRATSEDVFPLLDEAHGDGRAVWTARVGGGEATQAFSYTPDGGGAPSTSDITIPPPPGSPGFTAMRYVAAGSDGFLFGFVNAEAAEVVYGTGDDGTTTRLPVRPIEGLNEVVAFGGFVPASGATYQFSVVDAEGNELEGGIKSP